MTLRELVNTLAVRRPVVVIIGASVLFVFLAPLLSDSYNSLNQRAFLDLFLRGNPFTLAGAATVHFRGWSWPVDWPYPPLTILLDAPAWAVFHLTGSEAAYQFVFKLPLFCSAVITQVLLQRSQTYGWNHALLCSFFLFNPAILLLTTIAGGFETVSALLILAAYLLYSRHQRTFSALCLGLAGALRLYPFLLAPLYLISEWRQSHSLSRIAQYIWLCSVPLLVTCLPFVLSDWSGTLNVLLSQQSALGPFATINFASIVLYPAFLLIGRANDLWVLVDVSLLLVVASLVGIYLWSIARAAPLLHSNLLALLLFFLFYPKVHGLYTVSMLPLALMLPTRYSAWVWLPGAMWMLIVNGAFGATGLAYWAAPAMETWTSFVTPFQASFLTAFLSGVQMFLIGSSTVEVMRLAKRVGNVPLIRTERDHKIYETIT